MAITKILSRLWVTATLWFISASCAYAVDAQLNGPCWASPNARLTNVAHNQSRDPEYAGFPLAGLIVAAATGITGKKQPASDASVEELTPEECLAIEQVAQDWTDILAPYLTGVDPECAKETAFEMVAVGMAGQHQHAEEAKVFKETLLEDTYAGRTD